MSAIGSLIFCTDCGNLLQESTGDAGAVLLCDICGARNKGWLIDCIALHCIDSILYMAQGMAVLTGASRYTPQDHSLRVQTKRIPVSTESQKIGRSDLDRRRQADRSPYSTYMCEMWEERDVLLGSADAQCRRREHNLPSLCLWSQVWPLTHSRSIEYLYWS